MLFDDLWVGKPVLVDAFVYKQDIVASHDRIDNLHDAEGRHLLEDFSLQHVPDFVDEPANVAAVGQEVPIS